MLFVETVFKLTNCFCLKYDCLGTFKILNSLNLKRHHCIIGKFPLVTSHEHNISKFEIPKKLVCISTHKQYKNIIDLTLHLNWIQWFKKQENIKRCIIIDNIDIQMFSNLCSSEKFCQAHLPYKGLLAENGDKQCAKYKQPPHLVWWLKNCMSQFFMAEQARSHVQTTALLKVMEVCQQLVPVSRQLGDQKIRKHTKHDNARLSVFNISVVFS